MTAAPILGILCSIGLFILCYLYARYAENKARKKGEDFTFPVGIDPARYEVKDRAELPAAWKAFLPMIVLVAIIIVGGIWIKDAPMLTVIAMIIACFTPLVKAIYSIPLSVIGGLEIYLFGAIAAQGIAIMIDKKVDMFSAKNIAVIATISVIAIGGQYYFGGMIPFFGLQLPALATASIFGIVLNVLLNLGKRPDHFAEE